MKGLCKSYHVLRARIRLPHCGPLCAALRLPFRRQLFALVYELGKDIFDIGLVFRLTIADKCSYSLGLLLVLFEITYPSI